MAVTKVIATIEGQTYNLSYNSSSGAWEGTATAPGKSSFNKTGGYYGIGITAYDDSGNSITVNAADANFGTLLRLTVKETVKPTISIVSPTSGALLTNNKPTISWKCQDADSGVKSSTIKLYIDGTEVDGTISASGSAASYTCSYIPTSALSDGSHTLKFACTDNDGNSYEKSINIKIDTVAPTLTVSSPSGNIKTNKGTITVSGYTNDLTSSPVTVTVNGTAVTVNASGYFSTEVALVAGENAITVVATDGAGKTSTITRKVTYDNAPPVFESVSITPNPVNAGNTFKISVIVTDE